MNLTGASVSESILAAHETRDIVLPNQDEHVAHVAIDVNTKSTFVKRETNLLYTCRLVAHWQRWFILLLQQI